MNDNIIQVCSSLKQNWEQLNSRFKRFSSPYYPESQYPNLKASRMLRPLMISFWSLGVIKTNYYLQISY